MKVLHIDHGLMMELVSEMERLFGLHTDTFEIVGSPDSIVITIKPPHEEHFRTHHRHNYFHRRGKIIYSQEPL